MTRRDSLRALYEAVKAGELEAVNKLLGKMFSDDHNLPWSFVSDINSAFRGSLDAALALHNAVLPGWGWAVEADSNACVWHPDTFGVSRDIHIDPKPARALLLADLAAMIEQEGEG